ncbi:hypothetical protein PILCRDRAFT_627540 [Piloderma croceum F 1598]|uniref:Uncharacterized protein n=1 Tax=Piloderma croceum (strain F 1598) TaxID=765440 RepID=A0A0C3FBP6_PILCF|nr:hypothetical protein PILCRDRAFT_627540 [Piloderma croceum F 1598]
MSNSEATLMTRHRYQSFSVVLLVVICTSQFMFKLLDALTDTRRIMLVMTLGKLTRMYFCLLLQLTNSSAQLTSTVIQVKRQDSRSGVEPYLRCNLLFQTLHCIALRPPCQHPLRRPPLQC